METWGDGNQEEFTSKMESLFVSMPQGEENQNQNPDITWEVVENWDPVLVENQEPYQEIQEAQEIQFQSTENATTETTQPIQQRIVEITSTQTTSLDELNQSLQSQELLTQIAASLKTIEEGYSVSTTTTELEELTTEEVREEEETESTTSYYVVLNNKFDNMQSVLEIQARDQQLIGRIGIGCLMMIIGGFVIWTFLGRMR